MHSLLVVLLVAVAAQPSAANCGATCTKISTLLTNLFSSSSLQQSVSLLIQNGLTKNQPLNTTCHQEYECWAKGGGDKCIINQLIKGVPITKYMSLLSVLTSFTSCVKKEKTTIEAVGNIAMPTLLPKLNQPYKLCLNKFNTMTKNKMAATSINTQVCAIANGAFTKDLVQQCVNAAKAKVVAWKAGVWKCVNDAAPKVMGSAIKNLYKW